MCALVIRIKDVIEILMQAHAVGGSISQIVNGDPLNFLAAMSV